MDWSTPKMPVALLGWILLRDLAENCPISASLSKSGVKTALILEGLSIKWKVIFPKEEKK